MYFLVEETAVLAFCDPVIFLGKYEQTAGNLKPLQDAPVLQSLIHRHPEIIFANREQYRSAKIPGVPDWVLLAPHAALLPNRASVGDLSMVYTVARAPLRFQIDQSGMADQALVPGSG